MTPCRDVGSPLSGSFRSLGSNPPVCFLGAQDGPGALQTLSLQPTPALRAQSPEWQHHIQAQEAYATSSARDHVPLRVSGETFVWEQLVNTWTVC